MSHVSIQIYILMFIPFAQAQIKFKTPIHFWDEYYIEDATVEIMVVLEKNLSDQFETMYDKHSHFCKLIDEVNFIYQKINGIPITIVLKGLMTITELEDQQFLEKSIITNSQGTFIKAFTGLYEFRNFAFKQSWLKKYDAVLLLTKLDLFDERGVAHGIAFTGGLCTNWDSAGIATPEARTIAHEIAHLLGVEHDINYKRRMPYHLCTAEDYLMAIHSPSEMDKNLLFSSCSIEVFNRKISKEGYLYCLWDENVEDTAKCGPCNFLSRPECTSYESIMEKLGLDTN